MNETQFQPDWFSKPGDTLLTLMEQRELTAETLADRLGQTKSTVCGLLAGTVAIDRNIADLLSVHVGGSAKFWEARQFKYQTALARVAAAINDEDADQWVKRFPRRGPDKNNDVAANGNRQDVIKAYLAYFGVSSPSEWQQRYASFLQQTAFRTSRKIQSKAGPLSIWLRQGEIEAARIICRPWDAEALKERLSDIKVLSKAKNPLYYLPRIQRLCASAGVAVVYVRAPAGCAASGATRFLSPNKAMVILSLRYLSDDHFWFTLFHEFAHLLLHSSSLIFIEGEERIHGDMEREANEFAERQLIPIHLQENLNDLPVKREAIIRFAIEAGVSPGIVVGQMQHKGLVKRSQMNYLKKKFRWEKLATVVS